MRIHLLLITQSYITEGAGEAQVKMHVIPHLEPTRLGGAGKNEKLGK